MILKGWGKRHTVDDDQTWGIYVHDHDDHVDGGMVWVSEREYKGNDYKWGHDGNASVRRNKWKKPQENIAHHKTAQP